MRRVVLGLALSSVLVSSAALAAAAEVPPLPVEFSGRLSCGWWVEEGTEALDIQPLAEGALVREERRGIVAHPLVLEMSDSRLDGTVYLHIGSDDFFFPGMGSSQPGIGWGTWWIETVEGAWAGPFVQAGFTDTTRSTHTAALAGEGAYEGMTALWEAAFTNDRCGWSIRGLIVEGTYPPPSSPKPHLARRHQGSAARRRTRLISPWGLVVLAGAGTIPRNDPAFAPGGGGERPGGRADPRR